MSADLTPEAIAGLLAEHRFDPTRSQDGTLNYGWCVGGDSWRTKHVSEHEAHQAEVIARAQATAAPTTNPVLADALRYYSDRRTMNNPKGWEHVSRKVEQALAANVWPGVSEAHVAEARAVLASLIEATAATRADTASEAAAWDESRAGWFRSAALGGDPDHSHGRQGPDLETRVRALADEWEQAALGGLSKVNLAAKVDQLRAALGDQP